MEYFWAFSWIWIPIIAILAGTIGGAFKEWLKFKEKTQQLGSSTHELEKTSAEQAELLRTMQAEREALIGRIQNLEAIVTSQVWDAIHQEGLPPAEKQQAVAASPLGLEEPDAPSDADRAAQLARRLRV